MLPLQYKPVRQLAVISHQNAPRNRTGRNRCNARPERIHKRQDLPPNILPRKDRRIYQNPPNPHYIGKEGVVHKYIFDADVSGGYTTRMTNYVRMTLWVEKDQRKWLLKGNRIRPRISASEVVRDLIEAAQSNERIAK